MEKISPDPCTITRLKDAMIAQIENVVTIQKGEYLSEQRMCMDQAVKWLEKEIEGERILWKVGKTSRHERGSLGDKDVCGKVNQREGGKMMNQKISGVQETNTTSTSPSK